MNPEDRSQTDMHYTSPNGRSDSEDHDAVFTELSAHVPQADQRFQQSLEDELIARLRAKTMHTQAHEERQKNAMQMSIPASKQSKTLIDFTAIFNPKNVPLTLIAVLAVMFIASTALVMRMLPPDGGMPTGSPDNNGIAVPFGLDSDDEPVEQQAAQSPTATPVGAGLDIRWEVGTTTTVPDITISVYLYPAYASEILGELNPGDEIVILEQVGQWINVRLAEAEESDALGWIDGRYLITQNVDQMNQETGVPLVTATPIGQSSRVEPAQMTVVPTVPPPIDRVEMEWDEESEAGWVVPMQDEFSFEPRLVPVLIAREAINSGDEISLDQVVLTYWIEKYVPEGSYESITGVVRGIATVDIPQYSPILSGQVDEP